MPVLGGVRVDRHPAHRIPGARDAFVDVLM
jgi:hypothetical protein